jgi:hypothetical protein
VLTLTARTAAASTVLRYREESLVDIGTNSGADAWAMIWEASCGFIVADVTDEFKPLVISSQDLLDFGLDETY